MTSNNSIERTIKFADENNVAYGIKQVDGKPRVSSMEYLYDIAEGNIAGHIPWSKIGYNGDVDASTEDMIAQGGTYTFPEAAIKMDIVSSDDVDGKTLAPASTGARTVTIYGLSTDFSEISETITLDGTTPVETTNSYYRINNMHVATAGTGGKAAGNITLSEANGTTYKYSYIALGQTRTRQCVWTVPKDKTLYVTSIAFAVGGATKEKVAVFTTLAKYDNKAYAVLDFFMAYSEVVIEDEAYTRQLEVPTKLGSGVDLKVQVRGLVADCVCTCSLRGWVEDN